MCLTLGLMCLVLGLMCLMLGLMCLMLGLGIICFIIELHQFTSGTPYIPQKRKQNLQI